MSLPDLSLSLAYWLHMLATVTWIGGLVTLAVVVLPALRAAQARGMDEMAAASFLEKMQSRLQAIGWFSLLVLAGTGMFQMSASPHYQGFLEIRNAWATVMLAKHLSFGLMALISIYLTWGLLPEVRRNALRMAQGLPAPRRELLLRRETWLLRANLILAILVLLLTALARAS